MTRFVASIRRAGYGELVVLPELQFSASQREVLVLLGPNGAGKTTALRSLVDTVDVQQRSIALDGIDLSRRRTWELAHFGIAFVPDGARCFSNASVRENLVGAFEAVATGERRDEKENLFGLCYDLFPILKERAAQMAGSMSGGQRQMLAIARALMIQPKVLVLDEPSAGLAPKIVEELFEALRRVRHLTDVTIIMAEQNFAAAISIADNCLVLEEGHVALSGSVDEIQRNERLRIAYLGL